MRIAHLADLHLGRVFHGISLLEDQRHVLDQCVAALREREADVLLLAGDLYDRALPSADAVRLFDRFLREVNEGLGVPVIAIAGNHDSADHLGFGSWLFSQGDVHLRGRVERELTPITLEDAHGEVTFYPVPYVEPEVARAVLDTPEGVPVTHRTVVQALVGAARKHREEHGAARAVLLAHAFVRGEAAPDESKRSERNLYLGGVGAVTVDDLAGFDYVALGHLHRPQSLTPDGRVRYAGSLMKYSFDEAAHDKGMTLVELGPKGERSVTHVSLHPRRELAVLTGKLAELLESPEFARFEDCLVSVELTDHPPPLQAMERLRQRFPHAAELRYRAPTSPTTGPISDAPPSMREPEEVFAEFMQKFLGEGPDELGRELFREALTRARAVMETRS